MKLKTYRARSMADALTDVKRELGRDAVILHTRTFKAGGWFGIGGKPMVEITASSNLNVAPPLQRRQHGPARRDGIARVVGEAYGIDASKLEPEPARPETAPATAEVAPAEAPRPVAPPRIEQPAMAGVEEELSSMRRMMARVLECSRQATARIEGNGSASSLADGRMPDALFSHYLRMLESDLAGEIADEITAAVRDELSPAELRDEQIVHEAMLRRLSELIPVAGDVPIPTRSSDDRPHTIALVGPTGVGKTTTIAKLAATCKLRHGRKVGLVTSDTYRIAAVEQLRTYANIIGIELSVAMTPEETAAAVESLSDCDIVLIDTAGRSPNDPDRIEELRCHIDAARPHETHLVLSGAASERVMIAAAEKFAVVKPNRVIFTKLDEAVSFGVLVGVARQIDVTLSYVTTGQEVPDHIEAGRADRLARLVLDGPRAWSEMEVAG